MARRRINVPDLSRVRASHPLRAGAQAPRPFGERQADAGCWIRSSCTCLVDPGCPSLRRYSVAALARGSQPAHGGGASFPRRLRPQDLRVATALPRGRAPAGACARGRDGSRLDRWAGPPGPVRRRRPDRDRLPLPGLSCRRADALPLARRARPDRCRRPGPAGACVGCRARADSSAVRAGLILLCRGRIGSRRLRRSAAENDHMRAARALSARPLAQAAHDLAASWFRRMGVSLCVLARPGSRAAAPSRSARGRLLVRARGLVPPAGAAAGALPIGPAARPRPAPAPRRSSPQVSGRRRRSTSPWPARH